MRLPPNWTKKSAGHYQHVPTGVEVRQGETRRDGWGVLIPMPEHGKDYLGAVASANTRAAAIEDAETRFIPRVRAAIEKTAFAETGTPEQWPTEAVDDDKAAARRAAVMNAGRPTLSDATPGDLVKHITLGTVAVLEHVAASGSTPQFHVRFAFETETTCVQHPDDLVVLANYRGWMSCERWDEDPDHDEHVDACTPECLIRTADQELVGPTLTQISPARYRSSGGVEVAQQRDGTWSAYGHQLAGLYGHGSICSGQPTLASTYRFINRWRRVRNAQDRIIATYQNATSWRSRPVRIAEIREQIRDGFALGEFTYDDFEWAVIRLCVDTGSRLSAADTPDDGDQAAAVTPPGGEPQHLITLDPRLLAAWAEENCGDGAKIDGRGVRWNHNGQLIYRDTGRPVDEQLPKYIILHIITDRVRYAEHLESEASKIRYSRDDFLQIAADVRAGRRPNREPYVESYTKIEDAWRCATDLRLHHHGGPQVGKTYEIAPVTGTGACAHCHQPVIKVDGTWRHSCLRFNIDCTNAFDGGPHTAEPLAPGARNPLDDRRIRELDTRLLRARRALEDAVDAENAAIADGRPGNYERTRRHSAALDVCRAELAGYHARGEQPGTTRVYLLQTSETEGTSWTSVTCGLDDALPHESASDQGARYAAFVGVDQQAIAYRVHVFTDPDAADPDGVWTNLTDPCPPGQHSTGDRPAETGEPRADGSTVERSRCRPCGHSVWRIQTEAGTATPWVIEGDDLPTPTPTPTPTPDQTPTPTADGDERLPAPSRREGRGLSEASGLGLGEPLSKSRGTLESLRYRVETQTPTGWRTAQTGTTAPDCRPTYSDLASVADAILSNRRSVLRLGPHDPVPPVRVRAWHWPTGMTTTLAAPAADKERK